jgi:hypothetical protein
MTLYWVGEHAKFLTSVRRVLFFIVDRDERSERVAIALTLPIQLAVPWPVR